MKCKRPFKENFKDVETSECDECLLAVLNAYYEHKSKECLYWRNLYNLKQQKDLESLVCKLYIEDSVKRKQDDDRFKRDSGIVTTLKSYCWSFFSNTPELFCEASEEERNVKANFLSSGTSKEISVQTDPLPSQEVQQSDVISRRVDFNPSMFFEYDPNSSENPPPLALLIVGKTNSGKSNVAKEVIRKLHTLRKVDHFFLITSSASYRSPTNKVNQWCRDDQVLLWDDSSRMNEDMRKVFFANLAEQLQEWSAQNERTLILLMM